MSWITEAWRRLCSIPRRDALERGLDKEFRFHLDQQIEKLRREGVSADEARRQALVKFGGLDRTKETTRDEIRASLLEDSAQDVRYGLRVIGRSPGFAIVAFITLALGIGATSAIFSIVQAVMLKPLPYDQPDRIVTVWETNRGGTIRNVISAANYVAWRERSQTLEHFTMIGEATIATVADGQVAETVGFVATSDLFPALGVQPQMGRAYTPEEDLRGDSTVIVVSHEFWQSRLDGRSNVLGTVVTTNGRRRTVIGVMPPGFTIVGQKADFLIPVSQTIEQLRSSIGRGNSFTIARLRDGVSRERAAAEMRRIFSELEREVPERNARRSIMMFSLQEQLIGDGKPALFTLVGAVALVLLVACVNVANLLLARSTTRKREVALRSALGAKRGRLMRQMLVESLLLAGGGGIAGLFVAWGCHRGLLALIGDRVYIPRFDQMTLDPPMVAFTLAVSLVTGVGFGLVPALVATSETQEELRDGGRHGGSPRLRRVLNCLVVAEVALSLVLLAGAGLLMRSFVNLARIDPGFRAEGVLAVRVALPPTRYNAAQAGTFYGETMASIAALPGVRNLAATPCVPLVSVCSVTSFSRADLPPPAVGQAPSAHVRSITPDFFKTLQIQQLAGRDFADSDTAESPSLAIVNESLVREQFGGVDPLGQHLRVSLGATDSNLEIVGVVRDIKLTALDAPINQTIYVPIAQRPSNARTLVVRTTQDPLALASSVTRLVHEREGEAPVEVRTLNAIVGDTLTRPRVVLILVGVFAVVALLLAAVGVYGVMAYSVRERTREIGVRMALGASASSVFALVIGWSLRLVCIGVAAGLVAAAAVTRLLEGLLYNIEPFDAWTFGMSAVALLVIGALAAYIPARRGMRLAPLDALRTD